jgi:hypothetical protein|tara:strand:+ start:1022 stop:1936 length:915 start_codon:yes stop_codon:yes gene_type:complete
MYWKNNWLSYHYDKLGDVKTKTVPGENWKLRIKQTITRPIKSYHEELLLNAHAVKDAFNEPLDLLLSGGLDSELALRSYVEAKIPINVFIAKYNDNINAVDFHEALKTCQIYNVTPTIIDCNLKTFLENDAHDMWNGGYFAEPGYMIMLKVIESLDNIPVICDGINADNFRMANKTQCDIVIYEKHFAAAIHGNTINRPLISSWYDYSPELTAAFLDLNLHKWKKHKLITPPFNNANLHKLKYLNSNKLFGTRIRQKRSGWELGLPDGSLVPYIEEFKNQYPIVNLDEEYTEAIYSYTDFRSIL